MLQVYVSSISDILKVCCKCFMHMDVAKVYQDVAYVAMVVHVCCKLLFPMFHLFCRCMLQVCLFEYCICFTHMLNYFIWMLRMFLQWFQVFFRCVLKCLMHVSSVSCAFRHMLQVLHLPPRLLLLCLGVSSSFRCRLGIRHPLHLFSMLVMLGVEWALLRRVKRRGKSTAGAGVRTLHPSGRSGASKPLSVNKKFTTCEGHSM